MTSSDTRSRRGLQILSGAEVARKERADEWDEASLEGKWGLLRKAMTQHIWFNVIFTLGATGFATLLGAPELAKGIFYMVLALYFISLLVAGIVMLLLFFLSFVLDEED